MRSTFQTRPSRAAAALVLAAALVACERESPAGSGSDISTPTSPGGGRLSVTTPVEFSATTPPETRNCLPQAAAEFGEVPLGASFSSFPAERLPKVSGRCPDDCGFQWRDAVQYVIFEDQVSEKTLRVGASRARPPLDIKPETSVPAAQALLAQHGATVDPYTLDGETSILLAASLCDLPMSSFVLRFDHKGRLQEIALHTTVI